MAQLLDDWCIRDVTGELFMTFQDFERVVAALSNMVDFAERLCEEVTADAADKDVGSHSFEEEFFVVKKDVVEWLSKSFGLPGWGASAAYFKHGDPSVGLRTTEPGRDRANSAGERLLYVSESYLLSYSASLAPLPLAELFTAKCTDHTGLADEDAFATLFKQFKRYDKVFRDMCKAQFKPAGDNRGVPSLKQFTADVKVGDLVLVRRNLLDNFLTGEAFRFDILPRMVHGGFWAKAPVNAEHRIVGGWQPPMHYSIAFKPRWNSKEFIRGGFRSSRNEFTQELLVDSSPESFYISDLAKHTNWCELQHALDMLGGEQLLIDDNDLLKFVANDQSVVVSLLQRLHRFSKHADSRKGELGWKRAFQVYPAELEAASNAFSRLEVPSGFIARAKSSVLSTISRVRPYIWPKEYETDEAEIQASFMLQVTGLYGIMIASLNGIFIQMQCPTPEIPDQQCSYAQKWEQMRASESILPSVIFVLNFLTLSVFIMVSVRLFLRELFIVKKFDSVAYMPTNALSGRKGDAAKPSKLRGDERFLGHALNVLFGFPICRQVLFVWFTKVDSEIFEPVKPEDDDWLRSYRIVLDHVIEKHGIQSIGKLPSAPDKDDSRKAKPFSRTCGLVFTGSNVEFASRASYALCLPIGTWFIITAGLVAARATLFPTVMESGSIRFYPRFMRRLRGLNFECLFLLKSVIIILAANLTVACVFFFSPVYARFGGFGCAAGRGIVVAGGRRSSARAVLRADVALSCVFAGDRMTDTTATARWCPSLRTTGSCLAPSGSGTSAWRLRTRLLLHLHRRACRATASSPALRTHERSHSCKSFAPARGHAGRSPPLSWRAPPRPASCLCRAPPIRWTRCTAGTRTSIRTRTAKAATTTMNPRATNTKTNTRTNTRSKKKTKAAATAVPRRSRNGRGRRKLVSTRRRRRRRLGTHACRARAQTRAPHCVSWVARLSADRSN